MKSDLNAARGIINGILLSFVIWMIAVAGAIWYFRPAQEIETCPRDQFGHRDCQGRECECL